MEPWIGEGRALLERTPALLRGWVTDLPPRLLDAREGPGTFSPREIVAHLLQAERDLWVPRLRIILEHKEARVFPPFDRFAHRAWLDEVSIEGVLEEFVLLRPGSLAVWAPVFENAGVLARRGRHPEFGPVTAGQLFATWVVHDLTHVRQIARVLAKQFEAPVGPWRAYLTVLRETGSAPAVPAQGQE